MKPNQTSHTAFQSYYMALAIDITDGRGLSNEACRELLFKVLALLFTVNSHAKQNTFGEKKCEANQKQHASRQV